MLLSKEVLDSLFLSSKHVLCYVKYLLINLNNFRMDKANNQLGEKTQWHA